MPQESWHVLKKGRQRGAQTGATREVEEGGEGTEKEREEAADAVGWEQREEDEDGEERVMGDGARNIEGGVTGGMEKAWKEVSEAGQLQTGC